jgi:prepilin-type N-terminal cleavage/methylation domain-containing protein
MHLITGSAQRRRNSQRGGFTLLEILIVTAILSALTLAILSFQVSSFTAVTDQQALLHIQSTTRGAMEQISKDISKAITEDANFSPLYWANGVPVSDPDGGFRGICFREIVGADSSGAIYGSLVAIIGPHEGLSKAAISNDVESPPGADDTAGIVRLREDPALLFVGPGGILTFAPLADGAGPDGLFGTRDDGNTNLFATDGSLATKVLVPDNFAPIQEPMLRIDYNFLAGTDGDPTNETTYGSGNEYIVTVTIRVNQQRGQDYLFTNDMVVSETITLRQ